MVSSRAREEGFYEKRTRVTFFLPIETAQQHKAVLEVISYLEHQRKRAVQITGYTRSQAPDAVYFGAWFDNENDPPKWMREPVVLFVVDFNWSPDEDQFGNAIGRLRTAIQRAYEKYTRKKQNVIWIIAERALRYN